MKKVFVIALALIITLLVAISAQGAVHSVNSPFQSWTEFGIISNAFKPEVTAWYSLLEPEKGFSGNVTMYTGDLFDDVQLLNGQYYESELKFGSATYIINPDSNIMFVNGNYLFDFGLILGAEIVSIESDTVTLLSPGYYFQFNQGFAQASVDFMMGEGESELYGFELDAMYNLDNARFFGELYSVKDNDSYIMVGGLYQLQDNLVLGGKLENFGDNSGYQLGATWNQDAITLNGKLGEAILGEYSYYAVGGTYKINEKFSLGLDYGKNEMMDAGYALRVGYKTDTFIFNFCLNMDYMPIVAFF